MNSGPRLHRRTLIAPTALLVSVFSSSTVLAAKENAEATTKTTKLDQLELSLNDSKPALAAHPLLGKPYRAHRLAANTQPQVSAAVVNGQLGQATELQAPVQPPVQQPPPQADPPPPQQQQQIGRPHV